MYLSHLRKTEIWNFGSVLRILWNEFRNYLKCFLQMVPVNAVKRLFPVPFTQDFFKQKKPVPAKRMLGQVEYPAVPPGLVQ